MKLFKTISLVDRLKASPYNEASSKAYDPGPGGADAPNPPVIKQSPDLKLTVPSQKSSAINLKKLPDFRKKNDELIKLIRATRPKQVTPQPNLFTSKPLVSFLLPIANRNFSQTMKLEDRLAQPSVANSTRHLPHFFLSDFYTDYITITKLGVFNHISNTPVTMFNFIPNRVGVDVLPSTFEALVLQGTRSSNGQVLSIVVPNQPVQNILLRQGTIFTNGSYISQPTIQFPGSEDANLVSQGTFFSNGQFISRVNLETPPTEFNQGVSVSPLATSPLLIRLLQGLKIDNAGNLKSIISVTKSVEITQESIVLQPYDNQPKPKETQEPNKSKYQGDRALSILLPRIKHGSAFLANTDFGTQIVFQGLSEDGTQSSQIIPVKDFQNKSFGGDTLIGAQGEDFFATNRPPVEDFPDITQLTKNIKGFNYNKVGVVQGKPAGQNQQVSAKTGVVRRTGKFKDAGSQISPNYTEAGFITLKIGPVTFPALLTALSDSWSPSWNDQNFVGRQDTFKNFKGVTRSVSLGFKVVAWSGNSASGMWSKLNDLIKATSVGTPSGNYTKGPVVKITVGGLFKNVTCVCTSLKIDTNPAEYTWDVDTGHPMIADISMDFAMLVSNNGELFNAETNTYYG